MPSVVTPWLVCVLIFCLRYMKYETGTLTSHFSFHFHAREGELMQGMPEGGGREKERERQRECLCRGHACTDVFLRIAVAELQTNQAAL